MRFFLKSALALAAVLVLGGCMENKDRYPAPQPCMGQCGGTGIKGGGSGSGGGGQGGSGGTSGSGGAAATIDQTGTVHRLTSPDFQDVSSSSYAGAATIVAAGGMVSAPYGGANGTTFTLKGVLSGATWLLVQDDTSGASGVISTFSHAKLPVLGNFTIPVVDLGVLQNIASSLPMVAGKGVSMLAAQVILFVQRNGGPYAGAKVTSGSGGAQAAYDSGAGYSDSATATGPGGTVILFNAALSGPSTITITDSANNQAYGVEVQAAPGAATIATIELQ